ncbi:sigma-70 family RNA polymerase sigma factor [Clostridium perfringens]|nr:sigma-70 family RNA polymerase sigma factor [Clostridium perfringens]
MENVFIEELKKRNPDALEYVLDAFGNLIYKLAYMQLNSKELSEECVNDVLLKVWENIDGYDYDKSKFKNWLAAITKYSSIDILRKEKRYFENTELKEENTDSESIEDKVISRDELESIKERICSFKELDRNIFIQRFFLNKSVKDIANLYNMTPKAISLRILRGREKLSKHHPK